MRVVHVSPTYMGPNSLIGGAERYTTELASAMAQKIPTRLVSFGDRSRREQWGPLEVHIYRPLAYIGGLRWNPLSVGFLSSLRDADVIHCHQFKVIPSFLSILYGHLKGIPLFVTDLGGTAPSFFNRLPVERWVNGFLHISHYSECLNPSRSSTDTVIGAGINTSIFTPKPVGQKSGVLFVCRIRPAKGVHFLIEALPSGASLDVVGPVLDPEYLQHLQKLANGKEVSFHTACSDEDLAKRYADAAVTVLPSLPGTELLGLTLLESMACATPVICTEVGGMPEVVEDGVTGFIVQAANATTLREKLSHLLNHPDQAKEMGLRGRKRVLEHFTWDAVAERCLQAYQRSLA